MIDTFNPADNRHNVNAESRAEAAEARAEQLAAQLVTAQAALEQVTKERDAIKAEMTAQLTWRREIGMHWKDGRLGIVYMMLDGVMP